MQYITGGLLKLARWSLQRATSLYLSAFPNENYLTIEQSLWCVQFKSPSASFTADTTSGAAPLTVNFTDTSINHPTSWSWNFGDGGTSTDQNPSHTYVDAAGPYTVTLTATNALGSNTDTKHNFIAVS